MYEYIKKNKRFCEDGVEILRFRASFPRFENGEIDAFYETLSENCLKYCEETLFPRVRQEYIDDADEKKRFAFNKYTYELAAVVLHSAGDAVSVRTDVRFFGKKGRKVRVLAQNFRLSDGRLLHPLTAAKALASDTSAREAKRLFSRGGGLLFSDKEFFCIEKNGAISTMEPKRRKNRAAAGIKSQKTVVKQ